jgi:hypothetical protein
MNNQQQQQYNSHQRIIMGGGGYDSQAIKKQPIREEELDSGNIALAATTNMNTLSSNIQYHVLDPNRGGDSGEDYDDEEDTITDELTDDTTTNHKSQNSNRSNGTHRPQQKLQQHSPNDSCNFSDTNNNLNETSMINKQFIQARIVKTALAAGDSATNLNMSQAAPAVPINPPPPHNHRYNQNNSEFNQNFFNSTLNSDNGGADDSITISSKVNMSIANNNKNSIGNNNRLMNQQQQQNVSAGYSRDMYNRLMNMNSNTSSFAAGGGNTPVNTSQTQQNSSILSKSTTNMTNITPLASELNLNQNYNSFNEEGCSNNTSSGGGGGIMSGEEKSASDYENISTTALNDILKNYNSKQHHVSNNAPQQQQFQPTNTSTFSSARAQSNQNASPTSPSRFRAPPPVPTSLFECQPATTTQISNVKAMISKLSQVQGKPSSAHGNNTTTEYTDTDDAESMLSCQLITSASLLANRDVVKEAKRVVDTSKKRQMLPPPMPPPPMPKPTKIGAAPNILNPRSFIQPQKQSGGNGFQQQQQQQQFSQRINIDTNTDVVVETCVDVTKPPPMETMI